MLSEQLSSTRYRINYSPIFRFGPPAFAPALGLPQDCSTAVLTLHRETERGMTNDHVSRRQSRKQPPESSLDPVYTERLHFLPVLHEVEGKHHNVVKVWQKHTESLSWGHVSTLSYRRGREHSDHSSRPLPEHDPQLPGYPGCQTGGYTTRRLIHLFNLLAWPPHPEENQRRVAGAIVLTPRIRDLHSIRCAKRSQETNCTC